MNRRDFLAKTGLGLAGLSVAPLRSFGAWDGDAGLRWGLIGTGRRAWQHIEIIRRSPHARIVALCDIWDQRLERALEFCAPQAPATYEDYRRLLQRDDLDAILVATPNDLHRETTVAALERGLHVLLEKPMGITVAECDEMTAAATRSQRVLQVGLQLHYAPFYGMVADLLRARAIGDVRFIDFLEVRGDWMKQSDDPEEERRRNWRLYARRSGGTLLEKSCHYFDLFNWFVGSAAVAVSGDGGINYYRDGRGTLDHASVSIEFSSGAHARYGLCMYGPHTFRFEIVGETGMLQLDPDAGVIRLRCTGRKDEILTADVSRRDSAGHIGTHELHASFVESIALGTPPLVGPAVGRQAVTISLAAERAVRERCRVTLA